MTKRRIALVEDLVYWDFLNAEEIETQTKAAQEKVKNIPDCSGVYFSYSSDYEGDINLSWVFYKEETDEEYNKRLAQDAARTKAYKRSQFEQLKKELGL
jgi:hypothetical protein